MVRVYVVVAVGVTCFVPRAVTGPMPGSIVIPEGFSVRQTKTADSPGRMEFGRASKATILGGAVCAPRPCAQAVEPTRKKNAKPNAVRTGNLPQIFAAILIQVTGRYFAL